MEIWIAFRMEIGVIALSQLKTGIGRISRKAIASVVVPGRSNTSTGASARRLILRSSISTFDTVAVNRWLDRETGHNSKR